jgi:hypothetical protein
VAKVGTSKSGGTISQQAAVRPWLAADTHGNKQTTLSYLFAAKINYSVTMIQLSRFFYSPTDAQLNCLKTVLKFIYKFDIKTASTCFGAITIIRERTIRSC